jgi:N utilization substance protein B
MNKDEKRQARILALQVFFCFEQRKFTGDIKSIFNEIISFSDVDEEQKEKVLEDENGEIKEFLKFQTDSPSDLGENVKCYAWEIFKFTATNIEIIDKKISQCTEKWAFERLNAVDRNLLRIALAEMNEKFAVPPPVVINEAIEIAKIFGTDNSAKFVNAILDKTKSENLTENK